MRGQSVTIQTDLPPVAANVWLCIIVYAHSVFFHSQSIVSVLCSPFCYRSTSFWVFLYLGVLDMKENMCVYCVF